MKSLLFAAILSLTISGSALANNSGIPTFNTHATARDIPTFKGMEHFQKRFPQATDVSCTTRGQYTEVNFTWNGVKLQAFYDLSGEPVATSRFIEVNNLPISVQMSLKKEYPSGIMKEAVEFTDADDALSYYVTVISPKVSYLLHVSTSGIISVFKKMKQ